MNVSEYLKTREGALRENYLSRGFMVLLGMIILVLSIALVGRDVRVELVPSPLNGTAQLSSTSASQDLKLAWGLSIVNLMGNVSPRNAPFLVKTLPGYFTPRMYHDVVGALETQAKQITDEQLSVTFAPSASLWDEKRQRVVVSGETTTTGVRGNSEKNLRTYELGFIVRDYRVLIDSFEVYEGGPRLVN